jgi:hypothetical protein
LPAFSCVLIDIECLFAVEAHSIVAIRHTVNIIFETPLILEIVATLAGVAFPIEVDTARCSH